MNIKEALEKAKVGDTISAPSIGMYSQTHSSLVYWLLMDGEPDNAKDTEYKHKTLDKILNANWHVDDEAF